MKNVSITTIVREINLRSESHLIGTLQKFRRDWKHLSRPPSRLIFSSKPSFKEKEYRYHCGGHGELQFNIGYEKGGRLFRHGVAFCFKRTQSLPDPSVLFPKILRFNKFLERNPEAFRDLKMWEWAGDYRTEDTSPKAILLDREKFIKRGVFIFLGRHQRRGEIDYEIILDDFDRLLPLYEFVERTGITANKARILDTGTGIRFNPLALHREKVTMAIAKIGAKRLEIELRENELQAALMRKLISKYGGNNVMSEVPIDTVGQRACRADIIVNHRNGYWLYEAKIESSARLCIRKAVGQLLEYAYWSESKNVTRLIVVGNAKTDISAEKYLATLRSKFSIPIQYEQFES